MIQKLVTCVAHGHASTFPWCLIHRELLPHIVGLFEAKKPKELTKSLSMRQAALEYLAVNQMRSSTGEDRMTGPARQPFTALC